MTDESPRKTALFGLVTPHVAPATNEDEEIFLPASLAKNAALSPPYSPYPLNDVMEDEGSELVLPPPAETKKRQRPVVKARSRRKKIRKPKTVTSADVVVREHRDPVVVDKYYSERFDSTVGIDTRISSIIVKFGRDFFKNKKVLEIDCGVGLVSFQIAALLKADRMVGTDRHLPTVLGNCKQLRKFKHDGLQVVGEKNENFPIFCVRKMGTARVTNKPWFVDDIEILKSNFPFNIEFLNASSIDEIPKSFNSFFDIILCLNGDPPPGICEFLRHDGKLILGTDKCIFNHR